MSLRIPAISLVLVLSVAGCGSGNPQDSLEKKLLHAQQEAANVTVISTDGKWQRIKYEIDGIKHELNGEELEGSPLTAYVSFYAKHSLSSHHDTREAAEGDTSLLSTIKRQEEYNVTYIYRGGTWEIAEFRIKPENGDEDLIIDVDDSRRIVLWGAFK